jgi:hemerythrin-like metal-binding protein
MSNAVFLPEIDDEHKEIFAAVSGLQEALSRSGPLSEIRDLTRRVADCTVEHFAHEERLMRAARYDSLRWHKGQHDAARRRVRQFAAGIEGGDTEAGAALVEYLTGWLPQHTCLPDRMLGAFLRNRQRSLFHLTLRAGTKPADACRWVDSKGDRFDPLSGKAGY